VGDDISGDAGGFVVGFAAGSRIAGYRLEEKIGQGGMAVVFRARDERLGRLVALKILAPVLAADEAFQRRFIRESQAAAAVDDPHIIPVFEAGEADGVLFIAMRYVPGGDAGSLVHRAGPMPPGRAAAIISSVASALDAAHAVGLLHRDVKPANMLVDILPGRPDHVYLSDFGLSKGAVPSAPMTGTGQVLGTLDYIAPEQIEGKPVDGRADQYALACAAFELLTGAPPFRRDEAMAVMYAQLSQPPPRLTSRRPDLLAAADGVLAKALAKAPADRYASCGEFADALRGAFGLQPYASVPGAMPAAHPPTRAVWPAPPGAAQEPGAAGPAGAPGPEPGLAGLPTRAAGIPAPPTAVTTPGDGRARPPRRRRIIIAGIAILAVAGIAAAAILATGSGHSHGPTTLPIAAKSRLAPVTGDVYVVYRDGKYASAEIRGDIKGTTSGEVAQLYAQQFPHRRAPVPAGSVILHQTGTTASYSFRVTPSLATRYKVELFQDSAATPPLASSASITIYVTLAATTGNGQKCRRPVCREAFPMHVLVPAPALRTEIAKPWYPYFGLNLAPKKTPPAPRWLLRGAGHPHVTAARRVSPGAFELTITYSFRIGNKAYYWNWATCTRDTEAVDGIGLPSHHNCGDPRVLASAAYLG
jgi:hypothetical protein